MFTQGFIFHYVIFPHNRNTVRLVTTSDNKLINDKWTFLFNLVWLIEHGICKSCSFHDFLKCEICRQWDCFKVSTFLGLIHKLNPTEVPFIHQLCGFLLVCQADSSGLLNLMPPSCVSFICPLVSTRWHDSVNWTNILFYLFDGMILLLSLF